MGDDQGNPPPAPADCPGARDARLCTMLASGSVNGGAVGALAFVRERQCGGKLIRAVVTGGP